MDERGLAIWYMDDGYFSAKKYVEFCTHGFTRKENEKIADFLRKQWELNATVYYARPKKKSTGGYFVHLNRISSMRFLTLINNYLLPELRYKTYIKKYRDGWVMEKEKEDVIPVNIIQIGKASGKDVRSLQKYDIHVKDNYNYFAGSVLVSNSIPEGMYGAGNVKIWDEGEYVLLEHEPKKIVVEFKGRKLKGRYALLNFKEKNWLFFKTK